MSVLHRVSLTSALLTLNANLWLARTDKRCRQAHTCTSEVLQLLYVCQCYKAAYASKFLCSRKAGENHHQISCVLIVCQALWPPHDTVFLHAGFASNGVFVNHCLVAFLRRIADPAGLDLEAMLYQVRILLLASFHFCSSMHNDHFLLMNVFECVSLGLVWCLIKNRTIQSHGLAGPNVCFSPH